MQLPITVEVKGNRVLTSRQIAEAYQTTTDTIKTNFSANRRRYVEGKHYISLIGDELKAFKKQVRNPYLVANRASHLYLWTEKGALLHAKSLNTDKAWEVYDWLVDFYFRARDGMLTSGTQKVIEKDKLLDIPNNREIQDKLYQLFDYCTTMRTILNLYDDYIYEKELENMQEIMKIVGMKINIETVKLAKLKADYVK